jgi:hypothetical protein
MSLSDLIVFIAIGLLFGYGLLLKRFSLRSLLIVTTIVALVLGFGSAMLRALHY